jgi:hypothetical protein
MGVGADRNTRSTTSTLGGLGSHQGTADFTIIDSLVEVSAKYHQLASLSVENRCHSVAIFPTAAQGPVLKEDTGGN